MKNLLETVSSSFFYQAISPQIDKMLNKKLSTLWLFAIFSVFFAPFHNSFALEKGLVLEKNKTVSKKWRSHIENFAQFENNRNIGLVNLFAIASQSRQSITFLDLRIQKDNQDSNEYNAGLGYRKIINNSILGLYAFYDQRKSAHNNIFKQATFGIERLGERWDLRSNLYLPKNTERNITANSFIENGKLKVAYSSEKSLKGLDFEIGRKISATNSRLYFGHYHFFKDRDHGFLYSKLSGSTLRMENKFFNDLLTVGGKITRNQDSKHSKLLYFRIRIPFGKRSNSDLSDIEKRMTDTVIRDIDVVTNRHSEVIDNIILDINGQAVSSAKIIDLSSPADIDDEIENSGANSLVIVTGSGTLNDDINLNQGQVLIGGNSSISITYKNSRGQNLKTSYSPNLSAANINAGASVGGYDCSTGLGGSDCLIAIGNDNIAIQNINLSGGDDGIYITNDNLTNITLSNISISNNTDDGIYIHNFNHGKLNLSNINLNNIGDDGVYVSNSDNNEINLNNSSLSNITSDGFDITSGSNNNQFNIGNTGFSNIVSFPVNNKDTSGSNSINLN